MNKFGKGQGEHDQVDRQYMQDNQDSVFEKTVYCQKACYKRRGSEKKDQIIIYRWNRTDMTEEDSPEQKEKNTDYDDSCKNIRNNLR